MGKNKPEPAVYLEAMRLIGVEACDCVIFEDSNMGILGARNTAAKLCGVFMATLDTELIAKCDFHITSWW